MKTLHLVDLLSEDEKSLLLEKLKEKKRASLYKLFNAIKKIETQKPNKDSLYKSTFSEPYSADKDYLLRNELRLLNVEIETHIAEVENKTGKDGLAPDICILQRMLQLGKTEGFLNLFKDAERAAEEYLDYKNLLRIYDLVIDYYIRFQEVSVANYETIIHYLQKKQASLVNFEREIAAEINLRKNFSLKVIQSLDQEKFLQIKQSNKPASITPNPVADYLHSYAESYMLEGEQKINLYKNLIKKQPKVAKLRPERQKDLPALYGSLALTLFLNHNYKEADKYYLIAIKSSDAKPYLDLYFNYCVNALLIGKHKEVVNIYEKYYTVINSNEKLKYRFRYFTAIAYLMLEKPDAAFKMLDHEITQRPVTEYYYYRVVYAMVYFQKHDYENAERELENIMQSFRFRKTAKQEDKPLVKLLQKLVLADSFIDQKDKYKKEIQKIADEIDGSDKEKTGFSTVIYNWLVWQVKKRLVLK